MRRNGIPRPSSPPSATAGCTAAAPRTTRPESPPTWRPSAHTAAALPVGVTVFIEGEEESGSPSLSRLLAEHSDALAADVIVIADSDNWTVERPALTVSLRGLADCVVEVATLDHGLHSGLWGGVVPDALTVLVRLLATLHDDQGDVAVAGLHEGYRRTGGPRRRLGARRIRPAGRGQRDRHRLSGATVVGQTRHHRDRDRHHPHRQSLQHPDPTGPRQGQPAGGPRRRRCGPPRRTTPPPRTARALGRARHGDPGRRRPALRHRRQPVRSTTRPGRRSVQAWGVAPVDMGMGGSIPFIAEFAAAFPDAPSWSPASRIRAPRRTASTRACISGCWSAPPPPKRCCWQKLADQSK